MATPSAISPSVDAMTGEGSLTSSLKASTSTSPEVGMGKTDKKGLRSGESVLSAFLLFFLFPFAVRLATPCVDRLGSIPHHAFPP